VLGKRLVTLIAVASVVALALSRQEGPAAAELQPPDYDALRRESRTRILDDAEIARLAEGGTPVLGSIADDFMRSPFVAETRGKLERGFNVGAELDDNVHSRNLIRLAEALGPAGVELLVSRLDPRFASLFELDSFELRALGTGAVKPLLTMEMLLGTPRGELAKTQDWLTTFFEERTVREMARLEPPHAFPFLAGVAASLVASAVWAGGTWAAEQFEEGDEEEAVGEAGWYEYQAETGFAILRRQTEYLNDQLSESEREKMKLRRLDPRPR
jgi:hypothetical protein